MKDLREDRRPADLWFWSDWFSSIDVRSCSLAAQGLWVSMLGIMSKSDRKGFLSINGRPMDSKELAKFVGVFKDEVEELLIELEYYKVFSRDADGTIYNRRMAREAGLSRKRADAGRLGGLKQNLSKTEANVVSKTEATLEDEDEYSSSLRSKKEDSFNAWWEKYPRKVEKTPAFEAYRSALKESTPDDLLKALDGYLAEIAENKTEAKYIKHAATFLHKNRWCDYLSRPAKTKKKITVIERDGTMSEKEIEE